MICTLTRYYLHDQIKKNYMGSACVMYGRYEGANRVLVGKSQGQSQLGNTQA